MGVVDGLYRLVRFKKPKSFTATQTQNQSRRVCLCWIKEFITLRPNSVKEAPAAVVSGIPADSNNRPMPTSSLHIVTTAEKYLVTEVTRGGKNDVSDAWEKQKIMFLIN